MSLRLHPKHGVNPTIPLCFWCGENKNELILLGAAYKGEAPRNMLFDYDPCDTCKEKFELGVLLIEAKESPIFENQPKFQGRDIYPTGTIAVISKEAATRLFEDSSHSKYLLDSEAWDKLQLPRENYEAKTPSKTR